jgi:Domain of unknown function (DUF4424)
VYHRPVTARLVGVLAFAGLAGLSFVEGRARANDSTALLAGGEITFKKSEAISMESEVLSIKPDQVRVEYTFRNTTAADITTLVAFPMAPYEIEEEDSSQVDTVEELRAQEKWRHLGDFALRVAGRPVPVESTLQWSSKKVPGQKEDQQIVSVTYHWMQTFPAGKVVSVTHSFHPAGGYIFGFENGSFGKDRDGGDVEQALVHDYCVGPVLLRALKKARNPALTQVHYILKTGANWKGPIGRFTLRIQKEYPKDKISVCLDGFRKVDDRTFVLEQANFVPIRDLLIGFISNTN